MMMKKEESKEIDTYICVCIHTCIHRFYTGDTYTYIQRFYIRKYTVSYIMQHVCFICVVLLWVVLPAGEAKDEQRERASSREREMVWPSAIIEAVDDVLIEVRDIHLFLNQVGITIVHKMFIYVLQCVYLRVCLYRYQIFLVCIW